MYTFIPKKQVILPNKDQPKKQMKFKLYNEPPVKDMAIILCYFNPCKYNRIIQNMLYVKHFLDCANFPYFIAEIKHNNDEYFFKPGENIFQYTSNSYLFYKENLINTIVKKIPETYTKFCIMDFDILFDNPDWYSIISDKLNQVHVSQPFKHVYFLNLDYSIQTQKTNCIDNTKKTVIDYRVEHTGFIWAFDRKWFDAYDYDDKFISSMGDTIMANIITKRPYDDTGSHLYYTFMKKKTNGIKTIFRPPVNALPNTFANKHLFGNAYLKPSKKVSSHTIDSCDLNIYHLNHSPLINRQYVSINVILYNKLKELQIDTIDDILMRREDNILEWKPAYLSVFNDIMYNYFLQRGDDNI